MYPNHAKLIDRAFADLNPAPGKQAANGSPVPPAGRANATPPSPPLNDALWLTEDGRRTRAQELLSVGFAQAASPYG